MVNCIQQLKKGVIKMKSFSFNDNAIPEDVLMCLKELTPENQKCNICYDVIRAGMLGRINTSAPFNLRGYEETIKANKKLAEGKEAKRHVYIDDRSDNGKNPEVYKELQSDGGYEDIDVLVDYDWAVETFVGYRDKFFKKNGIDIYVALSFALRDPVAYFGARKNLVKLAMLEEDFSSALEIILKHGVDDKLKEIIGFKEGNDYEN